ncbi:MAG: sigma-70 family RNA polymerase sigma factor [Clostridia bacterium]|nr:sigma-70 family RNA polymerase sigma factor [Clostridia bacterium]
MGNHRKNKNIKNELDYFYAVVKNMDLNDRIKQSKINKHEIPLEENIYDHFLDLNNMDKQLSKTNLLNWIEFIENQRLYRAIKSLEIEDQILISHVMNECKTWQELAETYGITQANVKNRFNKIIRILKVLLFKK